MTETKQTSTTKTDRRPDCVTEIRMGNSVLTVSGFFKQGATDTAQPPHVIQSRYGIVGLAVGNGGIYVKTDHPTTNYRPLSKTVP